MRMLFIGGCPGSGTTWLRRIYGTHPEVVGGAESHAFRVIVDTFLDGLRGDDGWATVLARYDRWAELPLKGITRYIERDELLRVIDELRGQDGLSDLSRAQRLFAAIFEGYWNKVKTPRSTLLVEKTPNHIHSATMLLDQFPDARFLEVVRDGRDVCASLEGKSKERDWAPADRATQITMWVASILAGERLRAIERFRDRPMMVRYEDLHRDPTPIVDELFRFAKIECTPEIVADAVRQAAFTAPLPDDAQLLERRKGIVGDWKNTFDEWDTELVRALAGDLLERCGYEK